jgi:cysteine desulfurase family protein (TIGR01976 family)
MTNFDVERARAQFPALSVAVAGRRMAFFDGPGGTQVPASVIDAVASYYRTSNANHGGAFATSRRSDAIVEEAHAAVADLVGAASAAEIKFGANMTSLTFHVSRSIGAALEPGDEVVVSGLDHAANVDPWLALARDRGLVVRTWEPRLADCTLDVADLDALLGPRTRLVAFGWASNAVGTINPVAEVVRRAHAAGAWTYVDAVHAAPHVSLDVVATGTDFLACSVYKFFGPHVGALYVRRDVQDRLTAYKVRPADDRFETGTGNFEGYAGTLAAVEYLASIAGTVGVNGGGAASAAASARRSRLVVAMGAIRAYEMDVYRHLVDGLDAIPGLRLHGITDRTAFDRRTPTAALTIDGIEPRLVAERLGDEDIAVWDGDFYAPGLIERLGLAGSGGVVRIGLTHYNTAAEVDQLVDALGRVAADARTASPAPLTRSVAR